MLRGTRILAVLALSSGVACGASREFSAREDGGAAGTVQGSGGKGSGGGGRNGSGGTAKGDGGTATAGSAQTGGSHASGASAGTSATAGGPGSAGSAAEGGAGDTGEGGADASGGSSGNSASGGTGAESGTGASGGVSSAGTTGSGGSASGSGGSGAGLAGSGGSAADGGTSNGGTQNTAGTAGGGSGGQIGGCDNQLLANAGFDAGPTPTWRQESDVEGLEIIVHRSDSALAGAGVAPFSGDYLAWLGGIEDNEWDRHDVILRQDVTIPAEASRLTLSGRYWIQTEDSSTVTYDVSYLEFEDDEGVIWQARYFDNTDFTTGWTSFEHETTGMERLAGRTVTFVAYSRTDLTGKTSFFLDSLHLEASCGR